MNRTLDKNHIWMEYILRMPQKEQDLEQGATRTAEPIKIDHIDERFIESLIRVGASKEIIEAAKNFNSPSNK